MATGLGFPAISTPNKIDLRAVQTAISNARQRIEQLEQFVALLQSSTSSSTTASPSSVTLNALRAQIAALTQRVTALENQFVGDDAGIVVWNGAALVTRVLGAGANISITNADGVSSNPVISATGGGGGDGGDVILYDDEGRAALAADGGAIFEASGA